MKYRLKYLPSFQEDLLEAVLYISERLDNPIAADRLTDEVERAILRRLEMPLAFEPLHSSRPREQTYYRIFVRNFIVFYTVADDVMEVRRFLYSHRDIESIL